jgi:hypothetical protein
MAGSKSVNGKKNGKKEERQTIVSFYRSVDEGSGEYKVLEVNRAGDGGVFVNAISGVTGGDREMISLKLSAAEAALLALKLQAEVQSA